MGKREGLNQKLSSPIDLLVFGATGGIGKTLLEKSQRSGLSTLGVSRRDHKDQEVISTDYRSSSILEILKTYSPTQIAISIGNVSSNPSIDSSLIDDEIRSTQSILSGG